MEPYATQQDITDRYGEDALYLAFDRDGDGVIDVNAVERALVDATEEINTYLLGRYDLPLPKVPGILSLACIDLALYRGSIGVALTDEKRQRYKDQIALLTKIADGRISLGFEKPTQGGTGGAFISGPDRQFTRDKLRGMY